MGRTFAGARSAISPCSSRTLDATARTCRPGSNWTGTKPGCSTLPAPLNDPFSHTAVDAVSANIDGSRHYSLALAREEVHIGIWRAHRVSGKTKAAPTRQANERISIHCAMAMIRRTSKVRGKIAWRSARQRTAVSADPLCSQKHRLNVSAQFGGTKGKRANFFRS